MTLTENFAMTPILRCAASISPSAGALFRRRQVERDQVEDYAQRKGMSVAEVEHWLAPVLNYTRE